MDAPPDIPRLGAPEVEVMENGKVYKFTEEKIRSWAVAIMILTEYVMDQFKTCGKNAKAEVPDVGL